MTHSVPGWFSSFQACCACMSSLKWELLARVARLQTVSGLTITIWWNIWLLKKKEKTWTLYWATVKLYNANCIVTPVLSAESSPLTLQQWPQDVLFPRILSFFGILVFILKEGNNVISSCFISISCVLHQKYGPLSSLCCHHNRFRLFEGGTWRLVIHSREYRFTFPSHLGDSLL